jgi:transcriptional regulator GlxA family with amidase domain
VLPADAAASDTAAGAWSSLHRHFKATAHMSPLQYQKQLRLQEARTMLIAGGTDVGSVSAHVGYASTTQFTREYSRLFGAPPRRDADRSRSA